MKKGGGIGPVKPWQPWNKEGAKSNSGLIRREKISSPSRSTYFLMVYSNYNYELTT